ncbi:hypothetical protein SO802_004031 [Lithocarpus litseifolius]|uniref:Uncharacterized protein n=1 Tax=Lithocarpus litseifolius TaxID=425828 RepID=A0AAW2E2D0_9ROSI
MIPSRAPRSASYGSLGLLRHARNDFHHVEQQVLLGRVLDIGLEQETVHFGVDILDDSLSPTAHCSFFGVSCDRDSRAISLYVSNIRLFSFILPEIGLLNKLVNFTLAADNLTGMLPMEMANLTSLKVLNVSNNVFYRNFLGEITLGMTKLEIIDTYNKNFSGPLPTELVNLKNLKHLCLSENYFSGPIPDSYS